MKFAIAVVILFTCHHAISQNWRKAGEALRQPGSLHHIHTAMAFFNKYDTVPCVYTLVGNNEMRKGFKTVYVYDGFYTDDSTTISVFFDDRLRRVRNVDRFSF